MHWIRRSVGCRVASHRVALRRRRRRRFATRHSSPVCVCHRAARFIASVNLRRLTSRRVSGYLHHFYLSGCQQARGVLQRAPGALAVSCFSSALSTSRGTERERERDLCENALSIQSKMASHYAFRCMRCSTASTSSSISSEFIHFP